MYDIASLRRTEFPHAAEITYLNHAGISPLPQRSKRAIQEALEQLSINPNDYFGRVGLPALMDLQARLARYINAASPAEIVFGTSTSAASTPWPRPSPGGRAIACCSATSSSRPTPTRG